MNGLSPGSPYPPRSSSINKANEVLGQVDAMSTSVDPAPPEKRKMPRRFFSSLLPTFSGSSREKKGPEQTVGGAPYSNLASGTQISAVGVTLFPPIGSHVHNTSKYGRPNASSPNILAEPERKDGRGSLHYHRHSSFLPLTRLHGNEEKIPPQQILSSNQERIAHSKQSQNLLHLHSPASSSQSSLAILASRESSVPSARQSSGHINTTGPPGVLQCGKVKDLGRQEVVATQVPPRPETSTSFASETGSSYLSDASQASNISKSKSTGWTSSLRKWRFRGGKSKEENPKENDKVPAVTKIGWRRSTADLLSAYTGGDRRSEERDGPFWRKHRRPEHHLGHQSDTSEISLTGNSSYDSLNGLQNTSTVSGQSKSANARTTRENSKPQSSQEVGVGRSSTLPWTPAKDNLNPDTKLQKRNNDLKMLTERSPSSSSVSSIPSRSTFANPLRTTTSPPTGASSVKNLSLECTDFDSDKDSDSEEDEDKTITLKTHQNTLKKFWAESVSETGSLPYISEGQPQSSLGESDIYDIFHDGPTSASYGTFIKLLKRKASGQKEHAGEKCFHLVLSFLSPLQMIQLAKTSKKLYAAIMNAIFAHIHFRPGANFLSKLPSMIIGTRYSAGRQSISAWPYNQIRAAHHADIEPENFQQRNDIRVLVEQINYLEKMLSTRTSQTLSLGPTLIVRSRTQDTIARKGSFVKSLAFDSNWGIRGTNWKIMIPIVEKLLRNGGIIGLETFRWDLEIPITSDLMGYLASQEGSLRRLSLNGFHQPLNVQGSPSRSLPGPMKGFGGLVVLELQKLGFGGGERCERDKQYLKEIFGVIVRSPGIKVLRLGSGVDIEVTFPSVHVAMDETETDPTESTGDVIRANGKQTDAVNERHGLRGWIDLPVFDLYMFEEAYDFVHGDSSQSYTTRSSTTHVTLSPFRKTYTNASVNQRRCLPLKELSLEGFIVDQRLLNSEKFSHRCLETLKLIRCCYLHPSEADNVGREKPDYTTHFLLGRELRNSLTVIKIDEGFLCSAGKAGAKKMVKELFAGLPPSHSYVEDSPDGNLSPQITIRHRHGGLGLTRELYLLPSTYRGNQTVIYRNGLLRKMVLAFMRASVGIGSSALTLGTRSKLPYDCDSPVKILALSAEWRLGKDELGSLMTSTTGWALRELALDIGPDTWNDFLGLLPNLRNLTALYLYRPFARSFQSQQSAENEGSNAPLTIVTGAGQPKLISLKPRQKFPDQRFHKTQISHTVNTLQEALRNIPESQHNRHVIPSSATRGALRRRYPVDDASAILCGALKSMYRENENKSDTVGRHGRSSSVNTGPAWRRRFRKTNLAWIAVGRSVWQVVKLEPVYRPSKLEKETREAKLRAGGIVEVQIPILVGNNEAAFSDRWGLKRCSPQDAECRGVKIFNLGRQEKDEDVL